MPPLKNNHNLEQGGENIGFLKITVDVMSVYLMKDTVHFLLSTPCPAHFWQCLFPLSLGSHHHKIAVHFNGYLYWWTSDVIFLPAGIRIVASVLLRVQNKVIVKRKNKELYYCCVTSLNIQAWGHLNLISLSSCFQNIS